MIEDNVQLNYTVHNIRIIIFITFVGFKKTDYILINTSNYAF